MYPGAALKSLSIESRVSAMPNIETFMIELENRVINQASNYLLK